MPGQQVLHAVARGAPETGDCDDFPRLVRNTLAARRGAPGAARSVVSVARALGMNVRTLQRRLGELGTSFREVRDEHRRDTALASLGRDGTPINEVSSLLGYSDPAHFARAFRRWTGLSPSEYLRTSDPARCGIDSPPR